MYIGEGQLEGSLTHLSIRDTLRFKDESSGASVAASRSCSIDACFFYECFLTAIIPANNASTTSKKTSKASPSHLIVPVKNSDRSKQVVSIHASIGVSDESEEDRDDGPEYGSRGIHTCLCLLFLVVFSAASRLSESLGFYLHDSFLGRLSSEQGSHRR